MKISERVAFCRKRRGMSQEVLAGLIGRSTDWLSKVEHNRISLDRLSVIRLLAHALDVSLGDLIGEPILLEWTKAQTKGGVPDLRIALMGYRQALFADSQLGEPIRLDRLQREVTSAWEGYQRSRYSWLARRLPLLISDALTAS